MGRPRIAITIDLEFFDSVFRFRGRNPTAPPEARGLGIDGVEFVANLLEEHDARGTFFVLGEIAENRPELVSDLAERGHEIASHGYSISHPDLRELDIESIEQEIIPTREILEDASGQEITGYRAPAFAVDGTVLDIVRKAGFEYDSSIVPSRKIPGFYGGMDVPTEPFPVGEYFSLAGSDLLEIPVAVAPFVRLPISGAWLRLLGRRYVLWGIERLLRQGETVVIYVHPWELVDVRSFKSVPRRTTWRTGEYTRALFETILERYGSHVTLMSELSRSPGLRQ